MKRRPRQPVAAAQLSPRGVPADLGQRLTEARLDLRALFRALDELSLAQDMPAELHVLLQLDADFAEALWVMDQPKGRFDLAAMARDTLVSLAAVAAARERFLRRLETRARVHLLEQAQRVRASLKAEDAYLHIPGRDPEAQ